MEKFIETLKSPYQTKISKKTTPLLYHQNEPHQKDSKDSILSKIHLIICIIERPYEHA